MIVRVSESGNFNRSELTPLKSAEVANLHEALFYLAYDNARIHAQNEDIKKQWAKP